MVVASIVAGVSFGSQGDHCDSSSEADAGRAPASQLRSKQRSCLYPCGGGFREVLPPFARSPRPRTYSRVPGSPVSRLQALAGHDRRSYRCSAFSLVKTLPRRYLPAHIPFPKRQRRLPTVLSQEEVRRLIASAQNLMHRTMLMLRYATGLRRRNYATSRFAISTANAWSFMVAGAMVLQAVPEQFRPSGESGTKITPRSHLGREHAPFSFAQTLQLLNTT